MEVTVLGVLLCVGVVSGSCHEGTYGYECGYQCHCPLDKCNAIYGCSPGDCNTGWSGLTCNKENIALNKSTSASSVYDYGHPGNAVDGDNSTDNNYKCFQSDWTDSSITETWWRVDLGETANIRHVTIYFRTSYKGNRSGIQMYIADTAASPTDGVNCYNVTGNTNGTDIPDVLNVTCSGEGRFIVLYTTTTNGGEPVPILDFCEVEVNVCGPGTFCADCDNYCHCDGDVCNYVSGFCPSGTCMSGWIGESCNITCPTGIYGRGCSKSCTNRQCKGNTSSCSHDTGECLGGCLAGYRTPDCTQECVDTYGEDCGRNCSDRHCSDTSSSSCDHVTGLCDGGCIPEWKDVDCTTGCVYDVEYGAGCRGNCSARMCAGGSGTCPQDTGVCVNGCQTGWTGQDCIHKLSSLSPVTSVSPVVAGVVGAVTMLVVLAVVESVVCLCRKGDFRMVKKLPRQEYGTPETSHTPESSPAPPVEVPTYDVLPEHDYTKLDTISTEQYETLQPTVDYQNSDVRI